MVESLSHTTGDLIFKWNFTNPLYLSPDITLPQVPLDVSCTWQLLWNGLD